MRLRYIFFLLMLSNLKLLAQEDVSQKCIAISLDTPRINNVVGYSFCKTQDKFNKVIYVLTIRYNLQKLGLSKIGSDADFMFVFYVVPKDNNIKLKKIDNYKTALNSVEKNLIDVKNKLIQAGSIDSFDYKPILAQNGHFFEFVDADVYGQAFNLKEELQYFPEYKVLGSNRYELNLLKKPYKEDDIESLQAKALNDTSGFFRFDYDGFDGKWNIKSINKVEKSVVFWINLVRVATGYYSFGRFATEIKFKINTGITDFKVVSLSPLFGKKYNNNSLVQFNFKEFIDLKILIE